MASMSDFSWEYQTISAIILVLVFNLVMKQVLAWLHRRFERQQRVLPDSIVRTLYLPLSCYTWFITLLYTLNLLIFKLFQMTIIHIHLFVVYGSVLSIAWFILRAKKCVIELSKERSRKREITLDYSQLDVINKVGTILIVFLTLMILLEVSGVGINTLIAFGGGRWIGNCICFARSGR